MCLALIWLKLTSKTDRGEKHRSFCPSLSINRLKLDILELGACCSVVSKDLESWRLACNRHAPQPVPTGAPGSKLRLQGIRPGYLCECTGGSWRLSANWTVCWGFTAACFSLWTGRTGCIPTRSSWKCQTSGRRTPRSPVHQFSEREDHRVS
ncbi:hypothetical protein GOODEAATRI_023088 [Goodea atripinnis]|uniref:Uncharacterized protein n=1 Tax=Goodea atripinnis TaxID=208336 RepID=A0ABV0MLZ3_9TELE